MKNIMRIFLLLLFTVVCASLYAEDKFNPDENQYFSNPDTTVESKVPEIKPEEKKSLAVSGQVLSVLPYSVTRGYILGDKPNNYQGQNPFDPYMFGDAQFDARLTGNYKAFADTNVEYHPDNSKTLVNLREVFVDFNIEKAVYFRAGKQVLQWGRCYLWNPTDVINIQKTPFLQRIASREGTYGLKMTVPFGTSVNMYGFADAYHADKADQIGGAYKLEFLIGNTEMAFSVWGKKGYHPVGGYDFSTRILGWDVVGEATCSYVSNMDKIRVENGPVLMLDSSGKPVIDVNGNPVYTTGPTLVTYREDHKFIPKAAIDIGRDFDGRDISKRYSLKFEFFYNGAGYSNNVLGDTQKYAFDRQITITSPNGNSQTLPSRIPGTGSIAEYLVGHDTSGNTLYQANYLSRYYAAIFTTVNKLFVSELTLNINAIANLTDYSFIVGPGLTYQNINDFKAGLTVYTFLGGKNREYTSSGTAVNILATAGIIY